MRAPLDCDRDAMRFRGTGNEGIYTFAGRKGLRELTRDGKKISNRNKYLGVFDSKKSEIIMVREHAAVEIDVEVSSSETFDDVESVELAETAIKIAILGTGNYGVAFAERASRCGRGVGVVLGSRRGNVDPNGFPMPCPVVSYEKAVMGASIVVIAVPVHAHHKVVQQLGDLLDEKIVVDVSNSPVPSTWERIKNTFSARDEDAAMSNAESLQKIIEGAGVKGCTVVKAFNNISAYTLSLPVGSPGANAKACMISAGSERAKRTVALLARQMGFEVRDFGGLDASKQQEGCVHRFFDGWKIACFIGFLLSLIFLLYTTLTYFVSGLYPWNEYPKKTFLMVTGDVAAALLVLTFIPGPIAAFWQVARKTARKPFPAWFGSWLNIRKQLGLLAFYICIPHVIIACMGSGKTQPAVVYQLAPVFGTIAFTLLYLTATCSNVSVSGGFTWSEFRFVFVQVGYSTLVFLVGHLICLTIVAYTDITTQDLYPGNWPPMVLLIAVFCGLVLLLKAIVSIPPLSTIVAQIRAQETISLLPTKAKTVLKKWQSMNESYPSGVELFSSDDSNPV